MGALPDKDEKVRALRIAAQRSNGLAGVRTLQRMQPVRDAPQTRERIRNGEIKSARHAYQEALKEKGIEDAPKDAPQAIPHRPYTRLGAALYEIKKANETLSGDASGDVPVERISERIQELRMELNQTEKLIGNKSPE